MNDFILHKDSIVGQWEYDFDKDMIVLQESAAYIYYNEYKGKRISVEDFFSILSIEATLWLSNSLTQSQKESEIFFQNVHCENGQIKKVLVIFINNDNFKKSKFYFSVDVTKII